MIASAKEVVEFLLEGNRRFAGSFMSHPHQDAARRAECTGGQKPVAAVLGCADSRVPPEVLFDCGIGDIFIIRNAGTVLDEASVASIEYAVEHLNVPLVMVLGHTSCGAVTAAVTGSEAPGALGSLLDTVRVKCEYGAGVLSPEAIDSVIRTYTVRIASDLLYASETVRGAVEKGNCSIVAACYSLSDGLVTVL